MWNWLGVVAAGVLNGSFAVPMKTARTWKFEHIWMVHSALAMAVIPWAGVLVLVPEWRAILAAVPASGWLGLAALGLVWGVASLLFGVAVDLLGIALGFAIQLGLSIVLGSLLPLVWAGAFSVAAVRDALFLGGLTLMVAGVVLCAQAGGVKSAGPGVSGARFRKGLIVAILGGVGAPLLNFGIQYGIALLRDAGQIPAGAEFSANTYLAWAVFLTASAVSQAGYCAWRVVATGVVGVFRKPGTAADTLRVIVMASVWAASIALYGRSVVGLGALGTSFGWPILIGTIVLASNAWGLLLGEWRDAPARAMRRMAVGSVLLVVAAFLIGQGSR